MLGRHFSIRTPQSHPLAAQGAGKLLLRWFAARNLTLGKTRAFKPRRRREAAPTSPSFILNTRRFTAREEIVFRNKFVFGFYY